MTACTTAAAVSPSFHHGKGARDGGREGAAEELKLVEVFFFRILLWQTTPFFFFFFCLGGGGVVQPICLHLERLSDAYGGNAKSAREADDADANNLTNKTKTKTKSHDERARKERQKISISLQKIYRPGKKRALHASALLHYHHHAQRDSHSLKCNSIDHRDTDAQSNYCSSFPEIAQENIHYLFFIPLFFSSFCCYYFLFFVS